MRSPTQDLAREETLARVATTCRALHAGPRFVADFDLAAVHRRYRRIVAEHSFRLPAGYDEHGPAVEAIAGVLGRRPEPTVPCHNDLVAANLLDAGDRLWMIDFEYAGNNEACFELGTIWSEAGLPPEHLEALVAAYYGRPLRHKVARARLLGLLSTYAWVLWACIQDGASERNFDFWTWGLHRYQRAVAGFGARELPGLLDDTLRTD